MYIIEIEDTVDKIKDIVEKIDPITGEAGADIIWKSSIQLQAERAALINAKKAAVQARVDSYMNALAVHGVGNAAPKADYETKKIVLEHNGEFKVVLEA